MRGCVANTALSRIEKYDSSGTYVTGWGGAGSADGQFNLPQAVAVDGSGSIYVADTGHDRILVFGALAAPTPTSTPTATSMPGVIAVSDAAGTLAGTQAGITLVNNDPPLHRVSFTIKHFSDYAWFAAPAPTGEDPLPEPAAGGRLYLPAVTR